MPMKLPTIGSEWKHHNGNLYTVIAHANTSVPSTGKYPWTIVYRNSANGTIWSRQFNDWHRSMTLWNDAPTQPKDTGI